MATIKISVTGETCTVAQKVTFTAGSYGVHTAEVTTDTSWNDLVLALCIISAPPGYPRMPDSGRCIKCSVSVADGKAELDETIQPCMISGNAILVGLIGCDVDGKILRYSTVSAVGRVSGSACIDDTELNESRWGELISYINATVKSLTVPPTDEQVRNAVYDYAGEYGIITGATAEQAAQITANQNEITALQNRVGVSDVEETETGLLVTYTNGDSKAVEVGSTGGGGLAFSSWEYDEEFYLHLYDENMNDVIEPVYIPGGGGGVAGPVMRLSNLMSSL